MFQQGFKAEHAAVKPFAHSVLLADVLARRVRRKKTNQECFWKNWVLNISKSRWQWSQVFDELHWQDNIGALWPEDYSYAGTRWLTSRLCLLAFFWHTAVSVSMRYFEYWLLVCNDPKMNVDRCRVECFRGCCSAIKHFTSKTLIVDWC